VLALMQRVRSWCTFLISMWSHTLHNRHCNNRVYMYRYSRGCSSASAVAATANDPTFCSVSANRLFEQTATHHESHRSREIQPMQQIMIYQCSRDIANHQTSSEQESLISQFGHKFVVLQEFVSVKSIICMQHPHPDHICQHGATKTLKPSKPPLKP
jgi:hypothetical protein